MSTTFKPEFEIIRRNRVYEEIAKQIERLILKKLQPGDKLPSERDLAEMLRVSRGSIRDAIRTLDLMDLVEARQETGTIVREISAECAIASLLSLFVLRPLLRGRIAKESPVAEGTAQSSAHASVA